MKTLTDTDIRKAKDTLVADLCACKAGGTVPPKSATLIEISVHFAVKLSDIKKQIYLIARNNPTPTKRKLQAVKILTGVNHAS